jgi:hypothetical protein
MKKKNISLQESELNYLKGLGDDERIEYIQNLPSIDEKSRALKIVLQLLPGKAEKEAFSQRIFGDLSQLRSAAKKSQAITLEQGLSDESLLEYLNSLDEEERMAYILGLSNPKDQERVFNLTLTLLANKESKLSFAQRFNDKCNELEDHPEAQARLIHSANTQWSNYFARRMGEIQTLKNINDEKNGEQASEAKLQNEPVNLSKPVPSTNQESQTKSQSPKKLANADPSTNINKPGAEAITHNKDLNGLSAQKDQATKGIQPNQPDATDRGQDDDNLNKRHKTEGRERNRPFFALFGNRGNRNADKEKVSDPALFGETALSIPEFKGPFNQYIALIQDGNRRKLHDPDSSVPYRGLVSPSGQLQFAIEQGEKLEGILKQRGISPLNASPADREVLKRADAARLESQLQMLDRSKYAMDEWQRKIVESVSRFKKETLISALPDMMKASDVEGIKNAFNDALNNGLLDRDAIRNNMREISSAFMGFHEATLFHATNLIKDGQEEEATKLITEFVQKAKEIGSDGYLDEINNDEFSKKLEELSKKMEEMISGLLERLTSQSAPAMVG